MAYNLVTKNGYNMFEIASFLQKSARRGDVEKCNFSANELFDSYNKMLWKRIITISCEDCYGVLTKEILKLRLDNERDTQNVSKAIQLLCGALKSRDACYFACNFILSPNERDEITLTDDYIIETKEKMKSIDDYELSVESFIGKKMYTNFYSYSQTSLFENPTIHKRDVLNAMIRKSIETLDIENLGYALNESRFSQREDMWKIVYTVAKDYELQNEILSLKISDDMINGSKKAEEKDEIFISKAVMIIMYKIFGYDTCISNIQICNSNFLDWSNYYVKDIRQSPTRMTIPEYVYDVHTIKGKKMGKTDWQMNIDEYEGLFPKHKGFFDNGSWEPRYIWKHNHNQCSEKEYQAMLEYKKGRYANPVKEMKKGE